MLLNSLHVALQHSAAWCRRLPLAACRSVRIAIITHYTTLHRRHLRRLMALYDLYSLLKSLMTMRSLLMRQKNLISLVFLLSNGLAAVAFNSLAPIARRPPCLTARGRRKRASLSRISITSSIRHSTRLYVSKATRQSYPEWPRRWIPPRLFLMRPRYQFLVALLFYVFHLQVLTQKAIPFPFQLIPNNGGRFQSIGLDS